MQPLYSLSHRQILRILRDPDLAQDCFQAFCLRKLLNPKFQAQLAQCGDAEAFTARCAQNYARDWRRRVRRELRRYGGDPAECRMADSRVDVETATSRKLDRRSALLAIRRAAPSLIGQLCAGTGKEVAVRLCAEAEGRGLAPPQVLLHVVRAVYLGDGLEQMAVQLGLPLSTVRVYAGRLRKRIENLLENARAA